MTDADRWLDALPLGSPERGLLVAGRTARPPTGAVDIGWRALSIALGTAAASATVTTKAVATTAVAAKTASATSAAVTTKAVTAGVGLSLGAKSVVIGFAVGMGLLGAGTVVERVSHRDAQPSTTAATTPLTQGVHPVSRVSSSNPGIEPAVSQPLDAPAPSVEFRTLGSRESQLPAGATRAVAIQPTADAPAASGPPATESPTLAEQAQELAQTKRLLDAGATGEALRRLEVSFISDVHSALSEDRDALYIQALSKSQRRAQAESLAKRFLARYPQSPHAEKMRKLIASE